MSLATITEGQLQLSEPLELGEMLELSSSPSQLTPPLSLDEAAVEDENEFPLTELTSMLLRPRAAAEPLPDASWNTIRRAMTRIAEERGHCAGYPLPDETHPLSLAPAIAKLFPKLDNFAMRDPQEEALEEIKALLGITGEVTNDQLDAVMQVIASRKKGTFVNHWYNRRLDKAVWVRHDAAGRATYELHESEWATQSRLNLLLETIGCSRNQSMVAEFKAMRLLRQILGKERHKFRYYMLTGTFLETSPRSKITYVFRKGRPTLALRIKDAGSVLESAHCLCALCMHPVGYYQSSYAGCLCPTDDVIAHLVMMRGDEHLFWKRCKQHPPGTAAAGI